MEQNKYIASWACAGLGRRGFNVLVHNKPRNGHGTDIKTDFMSVFKNGLRFARRVSESIVLGAVLDEQTLDAEAAVHAAVLHVLFRPRAKSAEALDTALSQ